MNMKEMKEYLDRQSYIYYNTSETPELTDGEFDMMVKEYEKKFKKKYKVGSVKEGKRLVDLSHDFPDLVGTLGKTNTLEEVYEWMDKVEDGKSYDYMITPKYDGNSCVLTFGIKDYKLITAITRGRDGKGVDLTSLFSHIPLPSIVEENIDDLNDSDIVGIKVEVVMPYDIFDKKYEGEYANPRSVVAGILSSNDTTKEDIDDLRLIPLSMSIKDREDINRIEQYYTLREFNNYYEQYWGEISKWNIASKDRNYLEKIYKDISVKREGYKYMLDGLVIEIINEEDRQRLGRQDDRNNFDIALKFPYMTKKTIVRDIEYYNGNTGRITPVAVFDTLIFNGSKCNRVSLANYKRFKELNLSPGDEVIIEYRNDVLSYLIPSPANTNEGAPFDFIEKCPVCISDVEINENKTYAYCTNDNCPSNVVGRIQRYVEGIGIIGINTKTIQSLNEHGLLDDIEDLYNIEYNELRNVERLADKSAQNILENIGKVTDIMDYDLLGSLSFKNINKKTSKAILESLTIDQLLDMDSSSDIESKLLDLNIGPITSKNFAEGFASKKETIKNLTNILNISSYHEALNSNRSDVSPKTICFSGIRDKDMSEKLELAGHKVTSSVSKKTDMVVVKDTNSTSSKVTKAKELGIDIYQIEEFKEKVLNTLI